MPNYYLAQHEVDALVTYLLSRRPARVADALKIQYDRALSGPIAAGRHLVRELNCTGCHRIEDNVATIHQYISAASEDEEDDWDEEEEGDDAEEGEDDAGGALAHLGDGYGGSFDVPSTGGGGGGRGGGGGSIFGGAQVAVDLEGKETVVQSVFNLGTKTFFQKKGRWIDSTVTKDQEKQVVKLVQYSDEYFDVIRKLPAKDNQYFTLDGEMILNIGGQTYLIVPEEIEDGE